MSTPAQDQSKGPSPVVMQRVIAAIALGVAFLVLGSVFAPADTEGSDHDGSHQAEQPGQTEEHVPPGANEPGEIPVNAWGDTTLSVADSDDALPLIGTIEGDRYCMVIYGSDAGPRFTVYARDADQPLAVLLDRDALTSRFPDLPLPELARDGSKQLMLVDPDH